MPAAPALLKKILASPSLPSAPSVALRLLDLTRDPDSSTRDIVKTIQTDPALAAKILKAANSSYFGFRSEVRTLEQAVPLIGRTVVTSLTLSFSLSAEAMNEGPVADYYRRYWLQSLVNASAGESLARHIPGANSTELFMAGLLLDVGQLALLKVASKDYLPILEAASVAGAPSLAELEQQKFGFTHADVGAELMLAWKLPESIVNAIRVHHASMDSGDETVELNRVVQLTACVGDYFCGPNPGECLSILRRVVSEFPGIDTTQLTQYLQAVDERLRAAADLLQTDASDLPAPSDLMSQALEQLAEITLRQEQEKQAAVHQQAETEKMKSELESQNEKLREQVFRDPLTRLYNRRYFDEVLRNEVQRASRVATSVAVLFIDADRFKLLNDQYGHQFGDEVLTGIGESLTECLRSSDIAARFGGEEFVVLALETDETGLRILSERIRKRIEDRIFRFEGKVVPVTVSVGGCLAIPQRGDTRVESRLVEAADAAMYESKRRGRNCVTVQTLASALERRLATLSPRYRFSSWLVERGVINAEELNGPLKPGRSEHVHLGELACQHGWIGQNDVQRVLQLQDVTGERFGAIAHRLGLLGESHLAALLAEQSESAAQLAAQLVQGGILGQAEADALQVGFDQERARMLNPDTSDSPAAAPAPVSAQVGVSV